MVKGINAAAYVRMSSDRQDASPDRQRTEINRWAERNNYKIGTWYEDLGISGDATSRRKDFQRMIADGSTGKFNAIVCWDQDRFGRFDLIEAGKWIFPLREAGVHLATVTGGVTDWSDLVDQLTYMAKQMGKHAYLKDLARNVKSGHDKAREQGRITAGFAPFGYAIDPETKKLIPGNPEEVRTLKRIFERYAAGDSLKQVAAWLNGLGVKTQRGNPFQQRSVSHILKNERYLGYMVYGEIDKSKYLDSSPTNGKHQKRPRDEWVIVPNTHEPLISRDLWDAVQAKKQNKSQYSGPNSKNRYPLTGLLFCGHCGNRMGGSTADRFNRYICLTYTSGKGGCERRTVEEKKVLGVVLKQLRKDLFEPFFTGPNRQKLKDTMRKILTEGQDDAEQRKANEQRMLAELEGELQQAVNSLISTSEDLRPLVEKRVREIQDQRDEIADRVSQHVAPATEKVARVEGRIDAAVAWLDRLEEMIETDYDPGELSRCLRQYIDRIEINTKRTPMGTSGKRSKIEMTGGRIYFRTENFASWPTIETSVKLGQPLGRWSTVGLGRSSRHRLRAVVA